MSKGFIEQFNSRRISGWVSHNCSESITIIIDCDAYTIWPGAKRADILHESNAFSFDLPKEYLDKDSVEVSVLNCKKEHLQNSPLNITLSKEERSKFLVGLNDWLFLYNDSSQSIEYLTGQKKMSNGEAVDWVSLTKIRTEACLKNGTKLVTLVCPEKETIYSKYLPDSIKIDDKRPLNIIKGLCEADDSINFLVPIFDVEHESLSFSKGDSHWTYWGAFQAYKQLIEKFIPEVAQPNEENYLKSTVYQASDLLIKRDSINVEPVEYWKGDGGRETFNNQVSNKGRRQEYTNNKAPKQRVMIWHTSSIDWMKPFLLDDFSDVCLIWQQDISWGEVWRYNPDILIVQTNERFVVSLPKDSD